jgi:hypothetical protein
MGLCRIVECKQDFRAERDPDSHKTDLSCQRVKQYFQVAAVALPL